MLFSLLSLWQAFLTILLFPFPIKASVQFAERKKSRKSLPLSKTFKQTSFSNNFKMTKQLKQCMICFLRQFGKAKMHKETHHLSERVPSAV